MYCKTNVALYVIALIIFAASSQAQVPEPDHFNFDNLYELPEDQLAVTKLGYKIIREIGVTNGKITHLEFREFDGLNPELRCVVSKDLVLLPNFKHLRVLKLPINIVTDDWIPPLAKLANLEELWINSPKLSSKGLQPLIKLGNLKRGYLHDCVKLDDDSMEVIADWEMLEVLSISGCPKISDDGIHAIRGLRKLRGLAIGHVGGSEPGPNQSKITNRSIEDLSGFKEMRSLELQNTFIDEDGQKQVFDSLPHYGEVE